MEEQAKLLRASTQLLSSALDGNDVSVKLDNLDAIVCRVCKGVLCCSCRSESEERQLQLDNDNKRKREKDDNPPEREDMKQIRLARLGYGILGFDQHPSPAVAQVAHRSMQLDTQKYSQTSPHTAAKLPIVSGVPAGQTNWPAIRKLLPAKVRRLERCQPMFQGLLDDLQTSVWLPSDGHILQHVKHVIGSFLPGFRFKFGIAVDCVDRLHNADYGYLKKETKERDRVSYEGMFVVYVHPQRAVIAFAEHACIHYYQENCLTKTRCVNIKSDLDDQKDFDQSDEEREDAQGPHALYIAFGLPCNKWL
jgi:hypothetical protein